MNENEIKDEQSSGLSQHENVDQKNKKDKKNSKWNSFKDLISLKSKSKLYSFLVAVYTMVIILLGLASTMLIPIVDDKKTGITLMTSMAVPLSALLFVLSNIISEIFGKKKAVFALIVGYLMGMFVTFWLFLGWVILKDTPANNFYQNKNNHFFPFDALGPSWRFFVAGLIAFTVSTAVNVLIIWSMKKKYHNRLVTFRLFISSVIGQMVDNMTFSFLAYSQLGLTAIEWNVQTIVSLAVFEWAIELIVEAILSPITKLIIKKIQKSGLYEDLDGNIVIFSKDLKQELQHVSQQK